MPKYYEFEVTLIGATPRVWRSFLIRSTATFHGLHRAIQDACSWKDYHLYSFFYGPGAPELVTSPHAQDDIFDAAPAQDARTLRLSTYFDDGRRATACHYLYDFGDEWELRVELVGVKEMEEAFPRKLLGGARAFPPEDCGGLRGYEDCVALRRGEKVDDHENLEIWLGGWHPDEFDRPKTAERFNRGLSTWQIPFKSSAHHG